ncbi:Ig-like domain-containing protein [Streptomyces sp. RB6PN25]|uniref:Ig-like domain-containing protein n=1 Tax=Streptomyces humicola TaxID=2953240 RepID=A0ABT1PV91_9ACTN|nr:Ig-like domain-containing protein [Streptomyces humicola]MCQ4081591.1 Ig-like domain-containing protein [Streptomyces humicola]
MSHTPRCRSALCRASYLALLAPLTAGLTTSCSSSGGNPQAGKPYDATGQVTYSDPDGAKQADPTKPLQIAIKGGNRITDVTATDGTGRYVRGELGADDKSWHSTSQLVPGVHYTVRVSTENSDHRPGLQTIGFDTKAADNTIRVTFGPDAGTYGVGQPITAALSSPVKGAAARAVVERSLHVTSSPAVVGSWYWVDDRTLHFRPRDYWPANTDIYVSSSLEGQRIWGKVYGGPSAPLSMHTGDKVIAVTDAGAHELTISRNGQTERTIPITTGKPGFETRNGIKVVIDREAFVRMKSSTIGIPDGSSNSYDLPVYWAVRLTWSGEFVHAAPWSVGSQGSANVSHGCTGMSTDNAHWFFNEVRPGDIVQVVNSNGAKMEPFGNGFGDWNLSWDQWKKGSAIQGQSGESTRGTPAEQAALSAHSNAVGGRGGTPARLTPQR